MKMLNRTILRSILLLFYVIIIGVIILGISSVFSYLNTGADRSKMLHTDIKKTDLYLPKLEWTPLQNEGRSIDLKTLKSIEADYLNAWYVKHVAYKSNTTKGIADYYTENAKASIDSIIAKNSVENITIDGTTLKHNLTLEFFSEDGQLAVIRDRDVLEYKRIYKENKVVLETTEVSTYKLILLLEDGFWRIRHCIKEQTEPFKNEFVPAKNRITQIKGINYYPQATPWDLYGDNFDENIISKDFKIIKEAGLNSIRIFVPYTDFGRANVKTDKLEKIKTVLDIAENNRLKVMVTLFDFYGDYDVLNWTLNQRHAMCVVNALKNHKALLAWDIKNEPNLDFESRGKIRVLAWAKQMITFIKSIDEIHPVTIGWSNTESAFILNDILDFVSFHYYEDLDAFETSYQNLKTIIPKKHIAITEFGLSSYRGLWNPFGNSEKDQANYYKQAQQIFSENDVQFMSWTLYDFHKIPKEVVGRLPWRKRAQGCFGFINQNGETKPAFQYISKK